jgi:hypothetical protein
MINCRLLNMQNRQHKLENLITGLVLISGKGHPELVHILKAVVVGRALLVGSYYNEEMSKFTNWVTSIFS